MYIVVDRQRLPINRMRDGFWTSSMFYTHNKDEAIKFKDEISLYFGPHRVAKIEILSGE